MTDSDSKESRAENFLSRHSFWIGPAVVALAFVFSAALTWRKWPDIIVDFGTQLYIPWRLANGAVLYRDLYYFAGGPLSQYYNALLFKIFGVSFLTLIVSNLALVAAMLVLIQRRFLAVSNAWTAGVICLGIVLVFAFGEYTPIGNYNYAAPYSHEALHGLIVSVFALGLLSDWLTKEKIRFAFATGFCGGLVFLTKPDVFVAFMAAASAAFIVFCVTRRRVRFAARSFAAFFLAGIVPLLGFFLFFLRVDDWRESLRAVVFGWLPLFHPAITKNPFYLWCMGLDQPLVHLRETAIHFIAVILSVAIYAVVLSKMDRLKPKWIRSRLVILLLVISPLLFWAAFFNWRVSGSCLPLLCLSSLILICWNYKKLSARCEPIFPLLWSVFGLVLLLKMGLYPRIWHYGFALAMPAFVSAACLFMWVLPVLLERKFAVPSRRFSFVAGLVLLIGFGSLFNQSQLLYATKTLPVGHGADKIITYSAANGVSEGFYFATGWIEKYVPRDATMAVVPEGVTLNYLTRHVNPTPCIYWDPNVMSMFGQTNMTKAFEKNPPDYIVLIHRDSSNFGVSYFGKSPGYGAGLMQWIKVNYTTVILAGSEPLQDENFGIKILKRVPAAPPQNKVEINPP